MAVWGSNGNDLSGALSIAVLDGDKLQIMVNRNGNEMFFTNEIKT